MARIIGLAGPLRVGKDTVANYLIETHGFMKFSFSDALYGEVAASFGVADEFLRADATKETPHADLALYRCDNEEFRNAAADYLFGVRVDLGAAEYRAFLHAPRSPREILQMWGTEYRRKQDPDYWVNRAKDFVNAFLEQWTAAELKRRDGAELTPAEENILSVRGLVNTSVRFPNELEFIRGWCNGEVWHIYRRAAPHSTYVAEQRLPVDPRDREIHNNGSIAKLHTGISLLQQGAVREIIIED